MEFQAFDLGMTMRLKLHGVEPRDAERLMRESAAAFAAYRLATNDTVKPEESATLTPIVDGQPKIEQLDWGLGIELQSYYRIGRDPAPLPSDAA